MVRITALLFLITSTLFSSDYLWNPIGSDISDENNYVLNSSLSSNGRRIAISYSSIGDDDLSFSNPSKMNFVRIFDYDEENNNWIQLGQDLLASYASDNFGYSVSMSADGDRVAVSASGNSNYLRYIKVYELNSSNNWSQIGSNIGEDIISYGSQIFNKDFFKIKLSGNGDYLILSDPGNSTGADNYGNNSIRGLIKKYHYNGNHWVEVFSILGSRSYEIFGNSFDISYDGSYIIATAPHDSGFNNRQTYIYKNGATFYPQGYSSNRSAFGPGSLVSLNIDGSVFATNINTSNSIIVYSGNDMKGDPIVGSASSLMLSDDGNRLILLNSNEVHTYNFLNDNWVKNAESLSISSSGNFSKNSTHTRNSVTPFQEVTCVNAGGDTLAVNCYNNPNSVSIFSLIPTPDPLPPILSIDFYNDILINNAKTIDAYPLDGFPKNYSYQWYFNNFAIPENFGGTASSYTIDGIQSNEGDWEVVVTNDAGASSHSFSVNIVEDSDSDGIYNYKETDTGIYLSPNDTGTDPNNEDTDGDTILDGTEVTNGTNPNLADTDSDGLNDYLEVVYGADPNLADTSGDGLDDAVVVNAGFDPTVDYSNLVNASRQGMTDLRTGSTLIEVSGNQATVQLQMEESSDLQSWEDAGDPATMTIPADTDTKFFRFKMVD